MELLKLSESAFEYYKKNVKGNENITLDMARRKLTRNTLLAAKTSTLADKLKLQQEYVYGCLRIVVRFGTIVKLENHVPQVPGWKVNKKEYIRLSKILGIPQDKFKKRKHKVS